MQHLHTVIKNQRYFKWDTLYIVMLLDSSFPDLHYDIKMYLQKRLQFIVSRYKVCRLYDHYKQSISVTKTFSINLQELCQ